MTSAATISSRPRSSLWPLIIAPLVAVSYYLSASDAFLRSMSSALDLSEIGLMPDAGDLRWGSHWFYRIIAESVSIWFATFVAAGIARGRERAGGLIGGVTFSAITLIVFAVILWRWRNEGIDPYLGEPWYQAVVAVAAGLAAPFIGLFAGGFAQEVNAEKNDGFYGINRWHFLWLWLPAYWYPLGLISPLFHIYRSDPTGSWIQYLLLFIVHGIPVAVMLIPAITGLALLSGNIGESLNKLVRNLIGALVLIIGFIAGALLQFFWAQAIRYVARSLS